MLMAAQGVVSGTMTVGKFVLVNTYLMQLYQPLNFLGFVYASIKQGVVDMEQMFRLLQVNHEVADRPGAITLIPRAPGPGAVVFEDVHFGYRADREILHGISFAAAAGHKIAIVGPTGAGKSTISRLLFRFYDVTAAASCRWPRFARPHPGQPAGCHRRGAAGYGAVQRHHPL